MEVFGRIDTRQGNAQQEETIRYERKLKMLEFGKLLHCMYWQTTVCIVNVLEVIDASFSDAEQRELKRILQVIF